MNYFIIGGDKKEYGPATAEQIRQWLREGRANGTTLLRLESETLWKPLRSFEEFAADLPKAPDVAATPPPVPLEAQAANVQISIGHCFARGWHLVGQHFGVIAGATLLTWMALTALAMIPYLGPLLLLPLQGPLYASLFLVFLKLIRTGEAAPSDIFINARGNAVQLMLANIIITILSGFAMIMCVPGIYLKIAWLLALPLIADRGMEFWSGMEISRKVITAQWFRFLGLFVLAFLPILVFELYLSEHITRESLPALSKAMSVGTYQAFQDFFKEHDQILLRNQWLMNVGQLLLLVTMPLGFASLAFAYEDLFGKRQSA
jgi:hypothetical protein